MSEKNEPTTIAELAALIDPAAAQKTVAEILVTLGSAEDWNGDQLEDIAVSLGGVCPVDRSWVDQNEEDMDFWNSLQ